MSQIIETLQHMPLLAALDTLQFAVILGKETCQVVADLPYTDLWMENGWQGWWFEKDLNNDGILENYEGYDMVALCGAVSQEYDFALQLLAYDWSAYY